MREAVKRRHTSVVPYPSHVDPSQLGALSLEVVEAKGFRQWSLREVAARVGVSPNALYRYVPDKETLLILTAEAAARALLAELSSTPELSGDDDGVVELARRFVRFACSREEAHHAFCAAKPGLDHPSFLAWAELWAFVNGRVRAAVPASGDAAAFALWAFLQGRVELSRTTAYRAPADAGLEDAVRCLLEGFRRRGPISSPLPPHARLDDQSDS
ncbi:MAG: helix-turn-helix domain-containing protein [Myxococcota bacterium]